MKPYDLLFQFTDHSKQKKSLFFQQPIQIIQAKRVEEVIPALCQVEEAVAKGSYAAGYLSYESAPAFDPSFRVCQGAKLPLVWFGIYHEPRIMEPEHSPQDFSLGEWTPSISYESYQQGIREIKEAIARGDTYQVNYTLRLRTSFTGDDFAFYRRLTGAQQAGYTAYLNLGRYRILSLSPELFFHRRKNRITMKPMKGTIARGLYGAEDQKRKNWLATSEKNRAENVMIVDLLRNDLTRVAEIGTIDVPKLFEVEQYPTVWQMTSTVSATIRANQTWVDLLRAVFPCGSITGAPKVSTMHYIAQLENSPREVYCGAIGFLSPNDEAIFNVPIRTIWIDTLTGKAEYGVGGGITWDSTTAEEYEEWISKSKVLYEEPVKPFSLLESLLLKKGTFPYLERHLARLQRSATYFGYPFSLSLVKKALKSHAAEHLEGEHKVRLTLSKQGEIAITSEPVQPIPTPVKVRLAKQPIDIHNRFYYHKTTHRTMYEQHKKEHPDVFDVLLWNTEGQLTEFTIGNLVIEIDGIKYTPPVSCGLLAGVMRETLLNEGIIQERILTKADLARATRIWLINSVRGWLPAQLIE
jgi:para-aminobenzoate synthetase/4-amino-4-deoxychorismate lyase